MIKNLKIFLMIYKNLIEKLYSIYNKNREFNLIIINNDEILCL